MDELEAVTMPVLLVHGEHDSIVPDLAAMAHDRLPNASLALFAGCPHCRSLKTPNSICTPSTRSFRTQRSSDIQLAAIARQPETRDARSNGTRKISRLPSLSGISKASPASFCKSLRAV